MTETDGEGDSTTSELQPQRHSFAPRRSSMKRLNRYCSPNLIPELTQEMMGGTTEGKVE